MSITWSIPYRLFSFTSHNANAADVSTRAHLLFGYLLIQMLKFCAAVHYQYSPYVHLPLSEYSEFAAQPKGVASVFLQALSSQQKLSFQLVRFFFNSN